MMIYPTLDDIITMDPQKQTISVSESEVKCCLRDDRFDGQYSECRNSMNCMYFVDSIEARFQPSIVATPSYKNQDETMVTIECEDYNPDPASKKCPFCESTRYVIFIGNATIPRAEDEWIQLGYRFFHCYKCDRPFYKIRGHPIFNPTRLKTDNDPDIKTIQISLLGLSERVLINIVEMHIDHEIRDFTAVGFGGAFGTGNSIEEALSELILSQYKYAKALDNLDEELLTYSGRHERDKLKSYFMRVKNDGGEPQFLPPMGPFRIEDTELSFSTY